jgi:hypothetical protein
MSKINKMNILVGLFFVILVILFISPRFIKNLYSSIIGRIILIIIVLFFAMNNITLGLLTALIIIIASNMFLLEGLDNMETNTTDSTTDTSKDTSTDTSTDTSKEKNSKESIDTTDNITPVDLETIKKTIQSKSSNSLPVNPPSTTQEPAPSSTEAFRSMYSGV